MQNFELYNPVRVVFGPGKFKDLAAIVKGFGKKALIVSYESHDFFASLLSDTESALTAEGIGVLRFYHVQANPLLSHIQAAVELCRAEQVDFVIGIGGGSALDSAKAIAAMSALGGNIADYMGKEIDGEFPSMVLIPTTAGTGSEATKFTIITDTEKDIKMLLKGDKLLPDLAVLDYSYTLSAPKSVTAATGMDALTHAIESYTSRKANPITDTFALSALKRIFANLPTAYSEPENETAREQMLIAAYEAGVCINNASVTIPCDSPLETGTEFLQTIRNNKSIIEITNLDESIGRYRRSVIIDGSKLPENITGPVKLTVL